MSGSKILDIRELHKSFPGVRALEAVDFDLYEGEIHCLVGENGAGKSTLVEILSGNYRPDYGGDHRVDGEVSRANALQGPWPWGSTRFTRKTTLAMGVSAAENIYMGNLPGTAVGLFNRRKCVIESQKLVDSLGLALDVTRLVSGLSPVERKAVCIAKALSGKARVLILDEPTSTLGRRETAMLLKIVRNIRDQGIGIIYISHFINEIFDICRPDHRVQGRPQGRHLSGRRVHQGPGHLRHGRPDHRPHLLAARAPGRRGRASRCRASPAEAPWRT